MNDALSLLWPPFLVAFCLIGIHSYFGIQVLARNVIFVDLALAQTAALGTTVAFIIGHPPQSPISYGYSLGFTFLAALLLACTRAWSGRITQEAMIGVIYVVAAAAAILLVDQAPQGAEHLKQILTGNILTTNIDALTTVIPLYLGIGALHWLLRSLTAGNARRLWLEDFFFYATFGVVVVSSVMLVGVLLVFSFLIIPAAIGVLYGTRPAHQLVIAWVAGSFAIAAGLGLSYVFNLPTGAAMVCAFGVTLALAGMCHPFIRGDAFHSLLRLIKISQWIFFAAFAGSGVMLIAAPQMDQPILDSLEYALPSVRNLYFTKVEARIYEEAEAHVQRYRSEQERLNSLETQTRAGDVVIGEARVGQISSYLKSYAEMRAGEEFVKQEVRSRARSRVSFIGGVLAMVLALSIMPGIWAICRLYAGRSRQLFMRSSWAKTGDERLARKRSGGIRS
jgi:zinc/manganese transport system permease protein